MSTFIRFVEPGSLYFRRADLLTTRTKAYPPKSTSGGVVASMGPGNTFEDTWEDLKQERQGTFVSCWSLDESLHMWEKFAPQGVAVETRCGHLKAALNAMSARTMVGHVRYSLKHERFNILNFVTTKRPEFFPEQEVRAFAWQVDLSPRNPYPHDIPEGLSFPVDINALVERVIVSPHAQDAVLEEVNDLLGECGSGTIPVVRSGFTGYGRFLPTVEEIARYSKK